MSRSRLRSLALVCLPIGLGVVMRMWQWSAQTSMWLDEIWIAQNIRDRGLGELLSQPLANQQMAPPGFLAAVEMATMGLGLSEAALRSVPMVASILALLLLWRVAQRFLDGPALAAVLLIAALSPALIWYSGNLKQYSSDITLGLLLVWLGLRYLEEPGDLRRAAAAGGIGVVAVLSSHPAVLTAFVVGSVLVLNRWRAQDATRWAPLCVMVGAWAAGCGVAAWAALSFSGEGVRDHMRAFWAEDLAPWGEGLIEVGVWIPGRLYDTLAHFLIFIDEEAGVLAAPLAALAVVGLVVLWRTDRTRGTVLLAPVLAALLGGLTGLFPIDNRLAVHAGASIVVVSLIGWSAWAARSSRWLRAGAVSAGVIAVLPMPLIVLLASRPPLRAPDTRAVLESLAPRLGPEDSVYAYCYAAPAAEYYGASAGIETFEPFDCPRSEQDLANRIAEVPVGRVWFVYTDTPEPMWYDAALALLGERGSELERLDDPHASPGASGTGAVLFEIGAGA